MSLHIKITTGVQWSSLVQCSRQKGKKPQRQQGVDGSITTSEKALILQVQKGIIQNEKVHIKKYL